MWRLMLAAVAAVCAGNVAGSELAAHAPPAYAVRLVESLPPYVPREQVSGTIRLWGHGSPDHDFLGRLIGRWTAEFRRYQPRVRIVDRMYGTASAIGALYTGAGNLAILGEEISPAARRAFERERHYAPTRIEIATGSLETSYFDYAHMVFVNRANPIGRLSLGELAAVFGDRRGSGARHIRTWGQLGLTGAWAHRPIHPYFWKVNQDFALFFRARALGGSHHWNPNIRQFVTYDRPDGSVDDRGRQILEALASDPDGIAVSNIRFAGSRVKALALADSRAGPYVSATPVSLITQRYPLTRIIPAFVDLPPGRPLDPAVREFLRFILSRQGQKALIEDSGYLPLGRRRIAAQLRKLEASRCGARETCAPGRVPAETASRAGPVAASDLVRIWGNPQLASLAKRWASGFQATHPGWRVELHMTGSDTAMAGLYTGEAGVALMGRAATDSELKAFEWVYRHPPARVEILRGSVETRGRSPALVVFVHRGNPLRHIDLAQLRGLLEARPPPGVPSIRTWGELGLTGKWAEHAVDLYVPDTESGTGRYLREAVLGGAALLAWPRITEAGSASPLRESATHARRRILGALARDPYGLAIAWLPRAGAPVSPVPLGVRAAGPYLLPAAATIRNGRYPLGRAVYAYLDPREGRASEARQFVRYILSAEGQGDVARTDGYLPLAQRAAVNVPQWAQYVRSLPPYRPRRQVSGTVTSWGHGFLRVMMRYWERDFHRFQPNVRFDDDLASSAAAMAGLYTRRANLGVLAREILPMEAAAYRKMTGQKPFPVTMLTGAYADPDKVMALGVFVNRSNPLARLDFQQLDAIFDAQPIAGAPRGIRTWGQLGLAGAWASRPIHPYGGPASDEAPWFYFSQTVMRGSALWNCALKQLGEGRDGAGERVDGYQRAVDAVAADPEGIALSSAGYRNPGAKLLAIAVRPGGPYVEATLGNVAERSYPLSRAVRFYINDGPKIPPNPAVIEFLRYVLSREGQEQVLREGAFLPLTPEIAAAQRRKLPQGM